MSGQFVVFNGVGPLNGTDTLILTTNGVYEANYNVDIASKSSSIKLVQTRAGVRTTISGSVYSRTGILPGNVKFSTTLG
jgi:hypothetical protein